MKLIIAYGIAITYAIVTINLKQPVDIGWYFGVTAGIFLGYYIAEDYNGLTK